MNNISGSDDITTLGLNFYTGWGMPFAVTGEITEKIHRNNRFCFCMITEGSVIIRYNGVLISLIAPACLCINDIEKAYIVKQSSLKQRKVYFHPEMINSVFSCENIYDPDLLPDILTVRQDLFILSPFLCRNDICKGYFQVTPVVLHHLNGFINEACCVLSKQEDKNWPCRSRSFLIEILFLVNQYHDKNRDFVLPVIQDADDSLITRVMDYINFNFREKITIDDLSSRFSTNRTTLSSLFVKATGTTIVDYINKVRIQIACVFLRDTGLPVNELMYRVGFNDISHFNRIFKRYTGMPPGRYRNEFGCM